MAEHRAPWRFGGTDAASPGYAYTKHGALLTARYPSGRRLDWTYDAYGRPGSVVGVLAGATTRYVESVSYTEADQPKLTRLEGGVIGDVILPEGGNNWIVLRNGAILVPEDGFQQHVEFLRRIGRIKPQ